MDVYITHATESSLRWRHNDHAGVSNHQPHGCLLNRLFRRKSKKTSKLRVTGLCAGNSPGTGEFPAQMASYAENVSIWWRHHVSACLFTMTNKNIVIFRQIIWYSVLFIHQSAIVSKDRRFSAKILFKNISKSNINSLEKSFMSCESVHI